MTIQYIERAAPFALDPAIALLGNEKAGLAIDGINLRGYVRDRVTPANFFLGSLSDLLTYASPSTKRIVNKAGVLEIGTALRCEYDYSTGNPLGVRVEAQATNLLTRSEDLATTWLASALTVSTNVATAPDGALTADKIVESATLNWHEITRALAVTSGQTYTASIFLKAAERSYAMFGIYTGFPATFVAVNLATGAISAGTGTPLAMSSRAVKDGWWRVSVSAIATSTINATYNIRTSKDGIWANNQYTGDGSSGLYAWGGQFETGAKATSYIPTVASTVTRAADDLTLPLADFPWNGGSGTLKLNGATVSPILNGAALDIDAMVAAASATHLKTLTWVPA